MKTIFYYILCLSSIFVISCSTNDSQNIGTNDPSNPFAVNIRWKQLASSPMSFSSHGRGDITYDNEKIYFLTDNNKLNIYDIARDSWKVEQLPYEMESISIWNNILWGFKFPSYTENTIKAYSYTNGQWNSSEITKPDVYNILSLFFSLSGKLYNNYVSDGGLHHVLQEYDIITNKWSNKNPEIWIPSSPFPIIGEEWYFIDKDYQLISQLSLYSYNPTNELLLKRYTLNVQGAGVYIGKYKNLILVWNRYVSGSSAIPTKYSISSYNTETNQYSNVTVSGDLCFPPFEPGGYLICINNRVFAGPVNSRFYEMVLSK